ncbi:MAG: YhcH/YjgK/YiaL family protein [Gemmatimonadetes bacterium]|nr:YhcH/YjgK/YiaL family protein [Gemmatimonadota bacterium]
MIVTTLAEADAYANLAPGFATGLAWLRAFDPATPDGTHAIDGDEVYALVQSYDTGPATEKRFESHRRNLDIQWVASGTERILHAPVPLMEVETPYDEPGDIIFYAEPKASSSVLMRPDDVAIFLPPDGHKPGCMAGGRDAVRKVVVKVRLR